MASGEEETRSVANYNLGETLGKGGYSWVKKGIDKTTGNAVALKFMARADRSWEREQADQVRTEIKSMIRINSQFVMKMYAYNLNAKYPQKDGTTISTILLVLEFCPGGELFDILYYCQQLENKLARTYFRQMIQGLKDCHKNGIVHRDIKPQNLLLNQDYQLKITDFGLSHLMKDPANQEETMKTSYVGTRGYQAPELLKKEKYTKSCDIFSAGVVLFILLTGYPPFEQASKVDKWYRPIAKGDYKKFWKSHSGCGVPKDCESLLEAMLAYKPRDRITIQDIEKHKWFTSEVYTKEETAKILKKKHAEARSRRKKDKKKMSDMQNSVKKRDIPADQLEKLKKKWGVPPKAPETLTANLADCFVMEGYANEEKQSEESAVEVFVKAYECFKYGKGIDKAIDIPNIENVDPYCLTLQISDAKDRKFTMQLSMYLSGKDYVLLFQLLEGPRLAYNKLRGGFEDLLLANFFWKPESGEEQEEKTTEKPVPAKVAPSEDDEKAAKVSASG